MQPLCGLVIAAMSYALSKLYNVYFYKMTLKHLKLSMAFEKKKNCLHTPVLFTHLYTPLYIFTIFIVMSGWFLLASAIVQSQRKIKLVN